MDFVFQGSARPTIGVEIELQLLDPESLNVTPRSETLLEFCKQNGIDRVKAETHQSIVEIDSTISADIKECKKFFKDKLRQLYQAGELLGIKLSVTGTHPFQKWSDGLISNRKRYLNLHDKFQWLFRRMSIYGMHVHVGVSSGDRALSISNVLASYLPHLLALSANSPFWQEIDTGMQSSRISVLDSFPYAGIPPSFSSWDKFAHYYHTLLQQGVIGSLKDIYWYIRPNLGYGTIEIRICDGLTTLEETMAIAALIHCLVVWADGHIHADSQILRIPAEYQWIIPDNLWMAARDGLDAQIIERLGGPRRKISESLLEMIEMLKPTAHQLNCVEELQSVAQIIQKGNGAQRQRAVYQQTQSLQEVVRSSMREFEADLFSLQPNTI